VNDLALTDPDFWARPEPEQEAVFERLRAATEPVPLPLPRTYALTRYADVLAASRTPSVFSSTPISTSLEDMPEEYADLSGSMIHMDDPQHARHRRIVSRGFTPMRIKKLETAVETITADLVDRLAETGPCDFVEQVATPLPLKVICDMMGIPGSMFPDVVASTDEIILATGDPEYVAPDGRDRMTALIDCIRHFHDLMNELAAARRAHPADDLITTLVNASVDGESLTDRELGRFFVLLVVAGNETTRNAVSHALHLFTENTHQRDLLMKDLDGLLPDAIEETVRYASPVRWMRRTLAQDHGPFHEGDRVILFYPAANRDPSVFEHPSAFDIRRSPNPHVGFGAPGPHFCLGAHLARREAKVMLRRLFTRLPDLHASAAPVYQRSTFMNGIRHLPCSF
jgi:cytochrome P450